MTERFLHLEPMPPGPSIVVEEELSGALYMIARLEDETIDRIARRVIELLEERKA